MKGQGVGSLLYILPFDRHARFVGLLHPLLSLAPHTFSVLILIAIVKVVQQCLGSAERHHQTIMKGFWKHYNLVPSCT